jgi:hypothetical protein
VAESAYAKSMAETLGPWSAELLGIRLRGCTRFRRIRFQVIHGQDLCVSELFDVLGLQS